MKKYEVVQKLWGFYGLGDGGHPKRDKYCKSGKFLKKGSSQELSPEHWELVRCKGNI